jgi:choline dehydrogenase-like flavoprotein
MRLEQQPKQKGLQPVEVLIASAGPAGSVAAALLRRQGRQVLVLEREQFPRFSIGACCRRAWNTWSRPACCVR